MSITQLSTYAPQPLGVRASPTQLSVDPKGERLVYASGKSVFIRSIDDPSSSRQYTGHTAVVNVARFSPSGYYVASGDSSGMLRVWDCAGEDMNTKGEFPIISGPIKDLAWDGESKRIIAVGDGKEKYGACVTFDTGNSVGEITGQSSVINSVSIRQQRPYRAATASDDQTLVFFHGAPFKYEKQHSGLHTGFAHAVAFSPDGAYFVSGGADRKIFLFDGKTGELISEITGEGSHRGSIMSISWSPDSKKFVTASADQTVKIWDVESKTNIKTWKFGPEGSPSIPDHQVGIVWTSRTDGLIISLSLSGDLNYLNESSDSPTRVVSGHQGSITALAITKSKTLFTGSFDGRVCRWDLSKGLATIAEGEPHTNNVVGFAETSSLASVAWDDKLRHLDSNVGLYTGSAVSTDAQPKGIATLGDNTVVLTETELRIYSPTSVIVHSVPLDFTPIAVDASSSAGHIAVSGRDNKTRIFDTSSLTLKQTLNSNREVTSLSYSPSGAYLAAGESGGKITLHAVTTEYSVTTSRWAFHTARVESIAWNEASTHVVTGGLDCGLFVYSVERPIKNRKTRNAHEGGINAVAWESEDTVVSGGRDGAVKRWKVDLP